MHLSEQLITRDTVLVKTPNVVAAFTDVGVLRAFFSVIFSMESKSKPETSGRFF